MNRPYKAIWQILGWTMILSVVVTLLAFSAKQSDERRLKQIIINIDHSHDLYFIPENEISRLVRNLGYDTMMVTMGQIDLNRIEALIGHNPMVATVNVYKSIDGKLTIGIKQRTPIVRILNDDGSSYYLDQNGHPMPLSPDFTARVPIAMGHFYCSFREAIRLDSTQNSDHQNPHNKKIINQIYDISAFVSKDPFWSAQVTAFNINVNNQIEIIPRVGNHIIIFGDGDKIEDKFKKLYLFYQNGLFKTGWNEYSTINLMYKDQIVCKKR